ncbi:hypothetical protein RND81_06G137200 [Saponaria officinalis]|uniref:Uncharacterized protein n=1 Tax=Saponaria officinalis TaxID=3572 RepID=A0AAW1K5Q1_SAPOF
MGRGKETSNIFILLKKKKKFSFLKKTDLLKNKQRMFHYYYTGMYDIIRNKDTISLSRINTNTFGTEAKTQIGSDTTVGITNLIMVLVLAACAVLRPLASTRRVQ